MNRPAKLFYSSGALWNFKLSLKVTERVYLCTISIDSHLPRSLMVVMRTQGLDSQMQWAYYQARSDAGGVRQ